MFAKSFFSSSNMDTPSSVKFNYCMSGDSIPDQNKYYAYTNALHEAGHALGSSGYSNWDLLSYAAGPPCGPHSESKNRIVSSRRIPAYPTQL